MTEIMTLGSGETVYDRDDSHIPKELELFIPEALSRIVSRDRSFMEEQVEFGREIGFSICVETGSTDEIVWAQRSGRRGLTRFVKGRKAEPASSVLVVLKRVEKGLYFIVTAWFGKRAYPEPWDRNAPPEARMFWNTHALVWGMAEIVPGTETLECPW